MSGWPPYDQAAPYSSVPYTHPYPPEPTYNYHPVEPRPAPPPPAAAVAAPGLHHHPGAGASSWTTAPPVDAFEDDDAPDVIIIKNRGKCYALHFRAFAIGDGLLSVGDVRDAAADKLHATPARRVKLLYKGRLLKEDNVRAKAVGLKQNSQVLCVVSEDFGPEGSSSELSAGAGGEDDEDRNNNGEGEVVPVHTTTADGSGRGRRRAYSRRSGAVYDDEPPHSGASSTTHTAHHHRPRRRRTRSPSAPRDPPQSNLTVPVERRPSRSSASSPRRHSHVDDRRGGGSGSGGAPAGTRGRPHSADMRHRASLSDPTPNLNSASGPREKIEMLETYFSTVIAPSCRQFIEHPPKDAKERDFEHRRLSETTMTQLILKADEINIDGDETARQRRKSLIDRVGQLLKDVDNASES